MSNNHSGNIQNQIIQEEHDGELNAKRVNVVSGTITASSQVTVQPLSAWPDPKGYIGLVTITGALSSPAGNVTLDPGSLTGIRGNVTISDSKGFIGLTTSVIASAPTIFAVVNTSAAGQASVVLDASPNFIGIVTVANPSSFTGNITLDPGSLTGIRGNLTLTDSKGFIGLVTVGNIVSTTFSGNVTLDAGSKTQIVGNVTLSDPKTYIGLTTTTLGASPAFIGIVTVANASIPVTFAGNVTLDAGSKTQIIGNVTLTDSKRFIGLTTTTLGASPAFIGIVTVTNRDMTVTGNVTLSDSKNFIGLTTTTLGASPAFVGIVTITNRDRTITGNVTLSDSKGFIGLVTSVPAYGSGSTVYTGVISASGNTTVLVAPASNRFFIKNIHVSSLGRSEVEVRSGATTLIPFTSLSTTSGFAEHFGEMGLPGRAQQDGLVFNLNGAATISYMVNVRFEA